MKLYELRRLATIFESTISMADHHLHVASAILTECNGDPSNIKPEEFATLVKAIKSAREQLKDLRD